MSNLDKLIALTDTLSKVEENAKRERNILEFVIEHTTDGYWDWNLRTGYEYLSQKFKAQLGYLDNEMENSPSAWMSICHPEDLESAKKSIGKYINGCSDGFEEVLRFNHKEGHEVKILCRGVAVEWDEKGVPTRIVGTHVIID